MSQELQPGDLCVIVTASSRFQYERQFNGLTVILTKIVTDEHLRPDFGPWWLCVGVPTRCALSHRVLRKIPPAPMNDDALTDREVTV